MYNIFDVVRSGNVDKVREAIAAGADVNARDENGQTPLMKAIMSGETEIVEMLLHAGADVNAQDAEGNTALALALHPMKHGREHRGKGAYAKVGDSDGRYVYPLNSEDEVQELLAELRQIRRQMNQD